MTAPLNNVHTYNAQLHNLRSTSASTASLLVCTPVSLLHHKPCHHHWRLCRCHRNRRCPLPAAKPLQPRAHLLLLLLLLRRPLLLLLLPCLLV
jgi:hypothetical protein